MTRTRAVVFAAVAGLALAAGQVSSAATPAEERQATMKALGLQMKDATGLATGATPYDAAKAKAVMGQFSASAKKLKGLYPAGSGADPKTQASPKIWENKADFDKRLAEMGALATKAGAATTQDAYKPAFGALSATCKSCHDIYRKKKA